MGRLLLKILFAVALGALGLGMMLYQKQFLRENFERNSRTTIQMQSLHTDLVALKYAVLQANFFLYFNNDEIYEIVDRIETRLDDLIKHEDMERSHSKSHRELLRLKRSFSNLSKTVNRFLTFNASLKNSSIYLPTLALKAYTLFDKNRPADAQAILLLSKINASLFLAKNALDEGFVEEIRLYRQSLATLMEDVDDSKKSRLLRMTLRHLDLFIRLFPEFRTMLGDIQRSPVEEEMRRIMRDFTEESQNEMLSVNRIADLFMLLYLLMIGAVVYFIVYVEKESMTDMLTKLGNRKAYSLAKRRMSRPALVLINIDRFKHINEYYGAQVGDELLVQVGRLLQRTVPRRYGAKIYRLGGDDFGVLFEYRDGESMKALIEMILKTVEESHFEVAGIPPIEISVTVGASTQKERLFETADMALKDAKSSRRNRYVVYNAAIDKSEVIAKNIRASKQLRAALSDGRVIPYFQPIFEIGTGRITKYESLARIRLNEGKVLSSAHFLEAAKLSKLSGAITRTILRQTFEVARCTGAKFSVNIAASDISSEADSRAIFEMLARYREWAGQITFEILESEEVEDYEEMAEFIRKVRSYGAYIAIDDFGSGYSNFEKLLLLDIDVLKIDGTLIKDVDHDAHAEMVVETIVSFAKRIGLRTVAEFVHSKEVLAKVEALGITCAQGYHMGRPEPREFYFDNIDCKEC